ncbi:MAG: C39 family peptidase [Erysipelotrichaceae bacterium]|nr:C39 family peptidase [Erysipelotrichaceae bacterium]MDD3924965.1 C39 family peptidase [Erysipelotrichaceae bacterium]
MKKFITMLFVSLVLVNIIQIKINADNLTKVAYGPIGDNYSEYEGNPYYFSKDGTNERDRRIAEILNGVQLRIVLEESLAIIGYEQENNYYCGPASVKVVLNYLTGVAYSQQSLATAMGTTTNGTTRSAIVNKLNSVVGLGTYVDVSIYDLSLQLALLIV